MQEPKSVLVIEPERHAQHLIGQRLGDAYRVVAVASRDDALMRLRSDMFHLVTTPFVPQHTLPAFLDAVRKMQPGAKIILAGGFPAAAEEYDVDGFVQKPEMHGLAKVASDLLGST